MSNELICIGMLSVLYVYQSYRFWKLKLDMWDQIIELWRCQKRILQFIKELYERNKK